MSKIINYLNKQDSVIRGSNVRHLNRLLRVCLNFVGSQVQVLQEEIYLTTRAGGQLFSSAGHIAPLLVSRGLNFSQKGKVKA